uniref:flagellar filament capping protein FliD n=1 Tax=Acetatifactor sp. TaxID=1872090 RepID=UPI0040574363
MNVLTSAYNNYLTQYTPKSLTRYDTHKKSELRSVYNSIVKLNKEAPWYLPITNKNTQQYAIDLKENARELHNTIAGLGGLEESSLLHKKSAYSTNNNIATAAYIGTTDDSAQQFDMEVKSLASSQENMGSYLPAGKVGLPADTYSFDISIGEMNYEFQFTIGEAETNKEVQERLARLINNSDIGIKATVAEADSRTSLRLVSETTGLSAGKERIFTVSDNHTSKTSGTVEYFGLDYVSREASNASFLINGEEHTASSNHFTVGKMFEIELKGVSPEGETIEIGLKPDIESLTDNITHLIGGYNSFIKAAASYLDSQSRSKQLVKEMKGIANLYQPTMESMGLNIQEDGTMAVNSTMLKQAATDATDIAQSFHYIKDFSDMLLNKSKEVSLNPMNYVDRTMVAYKNPGRNYVSPYATSAYSGMMFNGYC